MARGTGGTTTFLFTDIEGSTRRWQEHPDAMRDSLVAHDELIRRAVESHGGLVFKHTGDGMCAAFESAGPAVAAAVQAQRDLASAAWPGLDGPLRVRMGLHTGDAERRDDDFFGPVLNRVARIMGLAHGGQVVLSAVTAGLLTDEPHEGVELVDLGAHRLRDLVNTERLHQVYADGLERDFPPLRSLDAFAHNLPIQRTSFVGRDTEIADVVKRLQKAPLVTLTGIGGAGKTRLALEAAVEVMHEFPDGVAFTDLGPLGDGDLVEGAVASAAGLQRGGAIGAAGDALDDLVSYLSRRRALVLLDNCEHLIEDCADLVDAILSRCPDVTVLATSREPLAVEGEHVIRVGPLPVSDDRDDAVRLFDERAAAVDHTYEPLAHRQAASDICRRLDGIPLAIELAAAQVSHLSPEDIADRLDDRFDLLAGGRRRVERQKTLEAALDWSHDLLDPLEQLTLRRLGVFAGSFTLADAEAVVAGGELTAPLVRRNLGSLVDKSLVTAIDDDGPSRYRLLETVRMYALQHLGQAGEAGELRDRHRDHFLAMAESTEVHRRLDDIDAATTLYRNVENLRAAMEWSRNQGRLDLVARQVAGSAGLYWIYGLAEEAYEWSGLAMDADGVERDVMAMVLLTRAVAQMLRGELLVMSETYEAASRTAESPLVLMLTQQWHGFSLMAEPDTAIPLLQQSIVAAEREGDNSSIAMGNFLLGAVHVFNGSYETALESYGVSARHGMPDGFSAAFREVWHAFALCFAGRPRDALAHLSHDRAGKRDGGVTWWAYGEPWVRVVINLELGEREEALAELPNVIACQRRHTVPLDRADAMLLCVGFALHDGDPVRASRLLGAIRGGQGVMAFRTPVAFSYYYNHLRPRVRESLPDADGRAAFREGRSLDLDLALEAEINRLTGSSAG